MLMFTMLRTLIVLSFSYCRGGLLPPCDAALQSSLPWSSFHLPVVRPDHRHLSSQPLKFWKRAPDDVELDTESMILSQNIIAFNDDAVTQNMTINDANSKACVVDQSVNSSLIKEDHSCWFDGNNNRRHRFFTLSVLGFTFIPPLLMILIPKSKSMLQIDDYNTNNASLDGVKLESALDSSHILQTQQQTMIASIVANVKMTNFGNRSLIRQNSSSFVNNSYSLMESNINTTSHYSAPSVVDERGILKRFFRRKTPHDIGNKNDTILVKPKVSKEELDCPILVTNIDELQNAVLIKKMPLRDVGFRLPINGIGYNDLIRGPTTANNNRQHTIFSRQDPAINGTLSSLLTYEAQSSSNPILRENYQYGIDLLSHHPVLSVVRERVKTNSKPGRRLKSSSSDRAHLALVIEGGGMRGAVSAGMAAALSTLDMLDAFDSIHGSSAGAIVGAYLVSRQLCTDVYTDIMPAAGNRFASKRMGMVNFGVDWLDDVIQRKVLSTSSEDSDEESDKRGDHYDGNTTSLYCDDEDNFSSVEMAMNDQSSSRRSRGWHDDPNDGLVLESASYLFSMASEPISSVVRRVGRVLLPTLSAIDFASSMRQYLRRRPGMNLT